jgi:cytochrome oxidase Cu insertion factor (SCO1/SenC/PrrC family)
MVLNRRKMIALAAAGMALPASTAFGQQVKNDPLANRFGGPFTLTDHTGQRVTEKTYRGQYMLIYFGFTQCTDACPVDVPNLVNALDLIKPLDAAVQPLFITVDPTDTAENLKDYVTAFHPRLVGLTGSETELSAVAKTYRVHRFRVKLNSEVSSPLSGPRHSVPFFTKAMPVHGDSPHVKGQRYSINHGTLTYLMGPDGGFLTIVPHNSKPEKIADVLGKYVRAT